MGMKFSQSLLTLRKNSIHYNSHLIHNASALLDMDDKLLHHKSNNCYEDDEPPCAEEIQHSSCSALFGSNDLDTEVNANMSGVDEDEDDADVCKKERRRADRKSHLLPHFLQQDTLTIKSGQCDSIDISNSYYH